MKKCPPTPIRTIVYNKLIFLKDFIQNIVQLMITCQILLVFVHFGGILQPILVVSLLSLTLFLRVVITGANRINKK